MSSIKQKIRAKNYSMLQSIIRAARYLYYKIIRLNSSPEDIARGLACGVFVGLLPVLPIQTILAIGLATLVRANKFTAALGTWVSNPLNIVFLYVLYHSIGTTIVDGVMFDSNVVNNTGSGKEDFKAFFLDDIDKHHDTHDGDTFITKLLLSGPRLIAVMFIGGGVLAIPASLLTYFISLHALRAYRKKKANMIKARELNKMRKLQERMAKEQTEAANRSGTPVE